MSFQINKVVKHTLVDNEMNVSDLAKSTNYSVTYLSNLLNGKRRWNEESLNRVCDALGLEIVIKPRQNAAHSLDGKEVLT